MKNFFLFFIFLFLSLNINACAFEINKIEPTFWFSGMKNPQLQLMVYGKDISSSKVRVVYPGVRVKEVIKADSPNYLFVYLSISPFAKPGKIKINFYDEKECKTVFYELKKRKKKGYQHFGFDSSDVLYLIMPDRFANGDRHNDVVEYLQPYTVDRTKPDYRHGGDLEGIRKHLGYFKDLGVTALWLTPVLENNMKGGSYHGYAITDFYKVDPRFGTNDEYIELVEDAHKNNLKIIMDMVFNHCGTGHPWMQDKPFKDWINNPDYRQTSFNMYPSIDPYSSEYDKKNFEDGWFVKEMPDLNQKNRHLMRYLIQNSIWWIEYADIDGIRMDTFPFADYGAMSQWLSELNTEYPNFNVVGEIFFANPAFSAYFQKDSLLSPQNSNLKSVMDFAFFEKINKAKNESTDSSTSGLNRIYENFAYDYLYANPSSVLAFLENHDTDRFCQNEEDIPKLKQALVILLTTNRIPQLYYGSEILMSGKKDKDDGYVRKDFPGGWDDDSLNAFKKSGRSVTQDDMYSFLKNILEYRKNNDVISKGSLKQYKPTNGIYVFIRSYQGHSLMMILNGTSLEKKLSFENYYEILQGVQKGRDIISDSYINFEESINLKPYQSLMIEF